jgi:hypothetical protein
VHHAPPVGDVCEDEGAAPTDWCPPYRHRTHHLARGVELNSEDFCVTTFPWVPAAKQDEVAKASVVKSPGAGDIVKAGAVHIRGDVDANNRPEGFSKAAVEENVGGSFRGLLYKIRRCHR